MYNLTDLHLHSEYSWDAQQKIPAIVKKAKEKGIFYAGITDHVDFIGKAPKGADNFDYKGRKEEIIRLRKEFPGLLMGAEIGEPHIYRGEYGEFLKEKNFDYLVGAVHFRGNETPVYDRYFYSRSSMDDAYREYFAEVRKLVEYGKFDILAHLDLVHRRGANFNKDYSYEKFSAEIKPILKTMVEKNIGLEINTSGLRRDAKDTLPSMDAVKAYVEAGGDIITVGSDAHKISDTFLGIEKAYGSLDAAGVEEITVFKNRKPEKIKLKK